MEPVDPRHQGGDDGGAETIPVDRATAVLVTNMKHGGALRPWPVSWTARQCVR
ncbi:hypothetical protein [Thermogymnomonas acidicola]|uniref:hypothetical protein n=1 Tax=Thermogymnomonas acidicola TaxID=399579 RepID=UPI001494CCFF|nr:hypothetical protein [Thermogymnomonas acidicola]